MRKALRRMKNGKTAGPNDILVDVWKSLAERAVEFLKQLFNMILDSEEMPKEWKKVHWC